MLERHGSRKTTGACSKDEVSPQLWFIRKKDKVRVKRKVVKGKRVWSAVTTN